MKRVEVKDENGNVVAAAEVEDHVHLGRMMAKLDKRTGQRSQLAIALREHFPRKQGEDFVCKCGEVVPTQAAWSAHAAIALMPPPTV